MYSVIGKPIPRREDLRLLRGKGRYTDDLHLPGQAYAYFLRSPHGHAILRGIDATAAVAAPGVVAVLTAEEYLADGHAGMSHGPNTIDAIDVTKRAFIAPAGETIFDQPQLPLARTRVRHVGDAVAVVIADTVDQAKDAAELVAVDYQILPAVASVLDATAPGAPLVYEEAPGNRCFDLRFGDPDATRRAFAAAALVLRHDFINNRIVNCQMEPRSALGQYDAASGVYTLIAGCQGANRLKVELIKALKVPADRVQVVCPDVGGGFGLRNMMYAEFVAVTWAAKRLGRPVKWTSERTEAFLSDHQGRDLVTRAGAAFDAEGRFLALDIELLGAIGAYAVAYVSLTNGYRIISTVYHVPAAQVRVQGVLTNTVPTSPYRGAGRPEATFVIERLLDLAARRLGIDRIEIRRRNLVRREAMPYRNVMGLTYDSGDFHGNMQKALDLADWNGFESRRKAAHARGRLRGIGIANYVESPVGMPTEKIIITVRPDDRVDVVSGTQSSGQGHETSFVQVVAEWLGVPIAAISLITGDTRKVLVGGGSHSDRSMRIGGTLMVEAANKIIAKGRAAAAVLLDTTPDQIAFEQGLFRATGSNRSIALFDLAREVAGRPELPPDLQGPLAAEAQFTGRIPAYPTGCAVGEVEVDPETGITELVRYSSVDDVGTVINPLIVHGQVHGGIAQGVGQALYEQFAVEKGTVQVLSGSFMDYGLPRADHLPSFAIETTLDPTKGNPLGVKGGGESGITPSPALVINALVHALEEFGIAHIDMPATPLRVWREIERAKRG